ncbi:hypothetical protein U1Q18_017291 [Sarracenia purpurea var. burkii]
MRAQSLLVSMVFLFVVLFAGGAAAAAAAAGTTETTIGEKCSDNFQKVTTCLSYATGKAAAPTKDCCSSVSEIKDSDPVCLCFIMQQTHDGGQQIKSMGIQESRLLQLPSACKLTNASISDCPKLLNLTASSPDYKLFMNSSSVSTTANPTTGTSLPTPSTTGAANGSEHSHRPAAGLVPIAMAIIMIFLCAFPLEVWSEFHT